MSSFLRIFFFERNFFPNSSPRIKVQKPIKDKQVDFFCITLENWLKKELINPTLFKIKISKKLIKKPVNRIKSSGQNMDFLRFLIKNHINIIIYIVMEMY